MAPELPAAAIDALTQGHKIEAIKILRQERGLGLKEAKDVVDTYVEARPELASQFQAGRTAGRRLLLGLLFLFLLIFFSYKLLRS